MAAFCSNVNIASFTFSATGKSNNGECSAFCSAFVQVRERMATAVIALGVKVMWMFQSIKCNWKWIKKYDVLSFNE